MARSITIVTSTRCCQRRLTTIGRATISQSLSKVVQRSIINEKWNEWSNEKFSSFDRQGLMFFRRFSFECVRAVNWRNESAPETINWCSRTLQIGLTVSSRHPIQEIRHHVGSENRLFEMNHLWSLSKNKQKWFILRKILTYGGESNEIIFSKGQEQKWNDDIWKVPSTLHSLWDKFIVISTLK